MGRLVLNSTDGATKDFAFGVVMDDADEDSRVWSMASVDSTVRGVLPIIATEDYARESVRGGPRRVVGGTHRFFGGGPGGGVDGTNRLGL